MLTVFYLLILGSALVMGYLAIVESREEKTKKYIKIIVGILLFLLVSNVFLSRTISRYREQVLHQELEARHHIWVISLQAEHIADKIDEFLIMVDDLEKGEEVPDQIHSRWNGVLVQSDDLAFHSGRISYEQLGEQETKWRELEYILSRVKASLFALNNKFLERSSILVTAQERERLEAIATMCRIIHRSVEIRPALKFEKGLLEKLEQYMLIVDPFYLRLSER